MGKYANFDEGNNVIWADFSGLVVNRENFDAIIAETIGIAKELPFKVYAISYWHNTYMGPEMAEYFGEQCQILLQHLKGLVRYGVANPITNITIRSSTLMSHLQGNNSHIYATKEEALAAVRQREKQNTQKPKNK